jgi:hypothetical protein
MAKIKLTAKDIPVLSKDLDLDEDVLKNLKQLQDSYKAKFEGNIQDAEKLALASYESKIKVLSEAKAKLTKEYDAEISQYIALVKDLKVKPRNKPGEAEKASKPAK